MLVRALAIARGAFRYAERLTGHDAVLRVMARLRGRFFDALADDFNTPAARAALFDWIAEGNRRLDAGERLGPGALREMLWVLGLDNLLDTAEEADPEAERLLEEREAARVARDFGTADAKRDELAALGWDVRDTPEGPKLVRSG